jgi:nucleotide-binding universal stress UspA family protein
MYRKILVPLDGSSRAEAILPHVEELARRYNARVDLLQIIEYKFAPDPFAAYPFEDFEHQEKQAKSYLNGIRNGLHAQKIETRIHVADGPVVTSIINIASQENVDLIALASHGRSGLARVYYGSVAAGILQRVDRPLLLIRSH